MSSNSFPAAHRVYGGEIYPISSRSSVRGLTCMAAKDHTRERKAPPSSGLFQGRGMAPPEFHRTSMMQSSSSPSTTSEFPGSNQLISGARAFSHGVSSTIRLCQPHTHQPTTSHPAFPMLAGPNHRIQPIPYGKTIRSFPYGTSVRPFPYGASSGVIRQSMSMIPPTNATLEIPSAQQQRRKRRVYTVYTVGQTRPLENYRLPEKSNVSSNAGRSERGGKSLVASTLRLFQSTGKTPCGKDIHCKECGKKFLTNYNLRVS
mmetsp:Transcript_8721/g.16927  ORF Transcript_8721/g.16927 Transcript_8721/m.16927 type:complete len:260 (+) Transcript_8721:76-855(+)